MLSDRERAEIFAEITQYSEPRAACIDALRIVQHHRGYVSDEALNDIAALLQMDPAELDGVATFYNHIFRRPVGRHVIHLCDSIVCWMIGFDELHEHLAKHYDLRFGATTDDGRFTLLPVPCLGLCDRAPALLIDGERYENLEPATLDALLARYR